MTGKKKPITAALVIIPTYAVDLLKTLLRSMRKELISKARPPKRVFMNQPVPSKKASNVSPAARNCVWAASVGAAAKSSLMVNNSEIGLAGMIHPTPINPSTNAINAHDSLTCLSETYRARKSSNPLKLLTSSKKSRDISPAKGSFCN